MLNSSLPRRSQLTLVLFALASAPIAKGVCAAQQADSKPRPPNIVLIIADDMTWRDCGPYGNADVRTPNLDALAEAGMTFERAFTATAMCSPTRQQLYTGVFPVRNGAYPNHSKVKPGTKSIVHHLRSLGFRVALNGKRHFGPPDSFPFEKGNAEFVTRDKAQPFCLIVASNSPHLPWTAGPRDYDPKSLTVPPYLVDNVQTRQRLADYYSEITAFDSEVGQWMKIVDEAGLTDETIFIATSEQGSQFPGAKWTCYDLGLRVALIVRWPGKVKAGSRTPAMVQYVDVVPTLLAAAGADPQKFDTGREGAPDGKSGFDGRSFLGVLMGETDAHNEYVSGLHTSQAMSSGEPYRVRSSRDGRYKCIWNLTSETSFQNVVTEKDSGDYWSSWVRDAKTDPRAAKLVAQYQTRPAEEFYDVVADPFEQTNLADMEQHRERMDAMKARLQSWMKQQGDAGMKTELAAKPRKR